MRRWRACTPVFARGTLPLAAARAAVLRRAADRLQARLPEFCALLVKEGHKTLGDAVAEVREAIDFCATTPSRREDKLATDSAAGSDRRAQHAAAARARRVRLHQPVELPARDLHRAGRGRAGVPATAVAAKPAEQTPCRGAGDGRACCTTPVCRPMRWCCCTVPAKRSAPRWSPTRAPPACASPARRPVAKSINRTLAAKDGPIVPLIAETGGINAMIVDSTALPEQVVDAVVQSAFRSAGQRCSALRLLCVHDSIADGVIEMMRGALHELSVGDPARLGDRRRSGDRRRGVRRARSPHRAAAPRGVAHRRRHIAGRDAPRLIAPVAFELPRIADLRQEIFGPVLHVVRWSGDVDARHRADQRARLRAHAAASRRASTAARSASRRSRASATSTSTAT